MSAMRCTAAILFALVLPTLHGCSSDASGRVAWHAFVDELRGPPDAAALQRSARFEHGGVAFDYPAVLRLRTSAGDDGITGWSLEYGQFELEVLAPAVAISVDDYLGTLARMFEGGRRIDAKGPEPGDTRTLCGHSLTSTHIQLKMFGAWSALEGFDLPIGSGQTRLLVFSDELVAGQPSRLARTTRERVLASLQCVALVAERGAVAASTTPPARSNAKSP
jgi:hypothetical protein